MKTFLIITICIGFLKFIMALKKGEFEILDFIALIYATIALIIGLICGFPK